MSSCSSSSESKNGGLQILPLAVGNQWVYRGTSIDTAGVIRDEGYDTNSVMRDTLTNGEQRYLVHFGFNLIFVNRPDGPWEQVDGRTNTWEMLRKYHAIKGDTFAWKGGIRVASIDTLITVPTGSYRSYHYTDATPSPYKRSDDYMAPGVGFLKMEFRQRADTKAGSPFSYGKIDLTSFRLH